MFCFENEWGSQKLVELLAAWLHAVLCMMTKKCIVKYTTQNYKIGASLEFLLRGGGEGYSHGNKPYLYLGLLKIMKVMLVLANIRLSSG